MPTNQASRSWILLLVASMILISYNLVIGGGDVCSRPLFSTNVCRYAISGVVFGFVVVSASVAYLFMERAFAKKPQLLGTIVSVLVAIAFAINAGLSTSPGSPGSEPSNIYWASWVCFALAFYLCMCHVEICLATWRTLPDKRMDGSHEQVQFVQEYHMSTNNSTFPMSTMALP